MSTDALDTALAFLRAQPGFQPPTLGIVAGSGLGPALTPLAATLRLPYGAIPGLPRSTVAGHAGELAIGAWGKRRVACLNGRVHAYEGHPPAQFRLPLRLLRGLGCEAAILLSSVGSIDPEIRPGRLVLVRDHINPSGFNPLAGANDDAIGPRFPPMVDAYAPAWRARAQRAAARAGTVLAEGILAHHPGPSFETPAEIRAYRLLGADLVGMSMVPEVLIARHCGLAVLGIGIVTNMGSGMDAVQPSHAETLAAAGGAAENVARLLAALLDEDDAP